MGGSSVSQSRLCFECETKLKHNIFTPFSPSVVQIGLQQDIYEVSENGSLVSVCMQLLEGFPCHRPVDARLYTMDGNATGIKFNEHILLYGVLFKISPISPVGSLMNRQKKCSYMVNFIQPPFYMRFYCIILGIDGIHYIAAEEDYNPTTIILSIPVGSAVGALACTSISIINDEETEDLEYFSVHIDMEDLNIRVPSSSTESAIINIKDDDIPGYFINIT